MGDAVELLDREQGLFHSSQCFCESVGLAAKGRQWRWYDGEGAEVVVYAFDLLMFRGKDVRLWPLEGRPGDLFETGKCGSLRRH
jgi:hypothetical protein